MCSLCWVMAVSPSEWKQTVEVIEVLRLSALLMIQDDSVKCSDEMRNKPALLQDVLGEDRPSFKHNVFHLCRLKNFNTGHCYILFSVVRCIILKKRGIVIFRQLTACTYSQQTGCNLPAVTVNRWGLSDPRCLDETNCCPVIHEYH